MPEYRVRDPQSNRVVVLRGDSPPTEQELEQVFAKLNGGGEPEKSWADTAIDALPTVGGMAGGLIGGIGGTVGGMGVGGVPGAIGGATLGGAAGEAARQLVGRMVGRESPATPTAAALGIGKEGAIQGVTEAAGGALAGGARCLWCVSSRTSWKRSCGNDCRWGARYLA
jgi:hypothetical protein